MNGSECRMCEGDFTYRFVLIDNGHVLECEQWDNGTGMVDGNKRKPDWVLVWRREI